MNFRISTAIWALLAFTTSFAQTAKKGFLDLSSADLKGNTLMLDGEWEFYWNELLTSDQLDNSKTTDYYTFPKTWNDGVTANGQELSPMGFATYRLTVKLPDGVMPALFIKHFYSSYHLYANGNLVATNGQVTSSADTYKPSWVPTEVEVMPEKGTLELVLQIANFDHSKGGARESILIADKPRMDTLTNLTFGYDLLLTGSLIMAGLFFLGLYFFGSRQIFVLYFSLFCLAFSYRVMAADDYVLHILYPDINWFVAVKLEYLSLFVPLIFFTLYTDSLFPLDSRHGVMRVLAIVGIVFVLLILFSPTHIYTTFVPIYLTILMFSIFCAGAVYVLAYRNKREGARFAMLSSGVLLLVFTYKIFDYIGVVDEYEVVSFVGYIFFFFFQSLILFFLFTDSLKKAKEQAELAAKSKSDFLSMMSHEIRTPMNAVIGLTNYLLEEEPKKEQVDTLHTLKFSAKNLLVIINDILDFSKIEAKKIQFESQSVNINDLMMSLNRVFQPAVKEKGIDLIFDIDPRLPKRLFCDPTRTSQVLTNLINNSVKFTSQGRINISLECQELLKDSVEVRFSVEDTGIGIAEEKLQTIFQSFTQASTSTSRQFGGTGLGLSITKQLLQLQNSDLFVESEVDKGSTFWFTQEFNIDHAQTEPEELKTAISPQSSNGQNKKLDISVLVVEDNEVNVLVVKKFLNKWGIRSVVATDGQKAIDCFKKEPGIDIILMDLQMPVMDGYEAALKLREMGVRIPIIALTASALAEEKLKISKVGMDDYVTKPFDPDLLYEKLSLYANSRKLNR